MVSLFLLGLIDFLLLFLRISILPRWDRAVTPFYGRNANCCRQSCCVCLAPPPCLQLGQSPANSDTRLPDRVLSSQSTRAASVSRRYDASSAQSTISPGLETSSSTSSIGLDREKNRLPAPRPVTSGCLGAVGLTCKGEEGYRKSICYQIEEVT
jgi:hypothetical protein